MPLFPRSRWKARACASALALFLCLPAAIAAAGSPPPPREVAGADPPLPLYEVDLRSPGAVARLLPLGLDYLDAQAGRQARVLGWPGTLEKLSGAGVRFREVSRDYGRDLARSRGLAPRAASPSPPREPGSGWNVPPVGEGSMAGYWNLDEVYAFLDSISAVDPYGIVGPVDTIGTSIQGRPILAVVVTDLSRPLGTRSAVFFNALTHAREPEGMQALCAFLSRLLAGYGNDPQVDYLVRERETWFVPVVNPDGYQRNCDTWAGTGAYGFWRKNLRQNDGNPQLNEQDGVDLNRNFDYAWGYNNVGSSSAHANETYRGTAPFSEPETQAIRDFCAAKGFVVAENFHTFGEDCLYPWSYIQAGVPDSADFIRIADDRMRGVGYPYGRALQILYEANGVAIDWMYGETGLKPKTYAYSTEIGNQNDEFWPPPERIVPLAALHLRSCAVLAYAAGVYLRADSLWIEGAGGVLRPGEGARAVFRLRHDGFAGATAGGIRVTVVPVDPLVHAPSPAVEFTDLAAGGASDPVTGSACFLTADPGCVPGTRVPLALEISGDEYAGRDTLEFRVGEPTTVFADDASAGLGSWTAGGTWGIESVDGNPAFSASPGGQYPQQANMSLALDPPLDLSGAVNAALRFRTRWEIEASMDFGRVEASVDSGATWVVLPGRFTLPGHGTAGRYTYGTQTDGEPGYFGTKRIWVDEEVDLASCVGHPDVRLRFRLTSDIGATGRGWWIDDVAVLAYAPAVPIGVADVVRPVAPVLAVLPNPTRGTTLIHFALDAPTPIRLSVYDVQGRRVRVLIRGLAGTGERTVAWDGRDALGRPVPSGAYVARLDGTAGPASTKILVVR
jgi:carboxypeptidase T